MALLNAGTAAMSPGTDPRFHPGFCRGPNAVPSIRCSPSRGADGGGQDKRAASARREVISSFM
jgi:hypothetical protein